MQGGGQRRAHPTLASSRLATRAPNSLVRRRAAAVGGRRLRPRRPDRALERVGVGGAVEPVAQHQRGRQEHRRRVGHAAPGDVRRGAVDGLEEARPAVGEARRRRQPQAAGDRRGHVGQDVAEGVLGDHRRPARPGRSTSVIAAVSTSRWSTATSGYSPATSSTTARHMREVARTLALSTDVSRPWRARASSKPRRATRRTWSGWYSQVSNTVPSSRRAPAAEVQAADELAHDQQVDAVRAEGAQVRVDVERRAAARTGPPRASRRSRRRPRPRRRPAAPRRRPRTPRGSPAAAGRRAARAPRRRRGGWTATGRAPARRARGSPRP